MLDQVRSGKFKVGHVRLV